MEYSVCFVAVQRKYGLTREMCRYHLAPFCFRSTYLAVQTFGGSIRVYNLTFGSYRDLGITDRLVAFHDRTLVCAPDILRNIDDGTTTRCRGRRMISKRHVSFAVGRSYYASGTGSGLEFDSIEVDGEWFAEGGLGFRIINDEVVVCRRNEVVAISRETGETIRTTPRNLAAERSVFVAPNGKTSALVDMDDHGGDIELVDGDRSIFVQPRAGASLIYDVDFSPDSTACAFAEDRQVLVVEVETGRLLNRISLPFAVDSIAFQTTTSR